LGYFIAVLIGVAGMADDKPKRKKFIPPKPPFKELHPGHKPVFGVGMQHERLVGRVAIEWSRLENILNDVIWRFLDLNFEDGRALTGRDDATSKINLLRVIAPRHLANEDKLEALLLALDAIDACRDDRNFVIHGAWGRIEPEGTPLAMSLRAKSKPEQVTGETFPTTRMYQIIARIIAMREMLGLLLNEIDASPDTLLK
jgi:hypothetical protein